MIDRLTNRSLHIDGILALWVILEEGNQVLIELDFRFRLIGLALQRALESSVIRQKHRLPDVHIQCFEA